jgi:DNA helicase-2/ATP-dependent DNA helicase PcrA
MQLEPLNEPQAAAVAHTDGPLIVFAGAGSGKTRVITYRIANLVARHRVPPYALLAVTFTNKAAGEMRSRLERMLGADLTRELWVGTFHAMCVRLLRRHHDEAGLKQSFVIYDSADQKAVMNRVIKELGIDDRRYPPQKVLARIHREKQEARGPEDMEVGNYFDEGVRRCFEAYERHMKESNAVDFEDLLLAVLRLAENPKSDAGESMRRKFQHVLVDEFQDVNHVQYRLVRALTAQHRNICVVGDDDQSIYRWRGADVRNIRGFTRDYPGAKMVKLEQNYRSSQCIVRAALGVIRPSLERQPKQLWTTNPEGDRVCVVHTANERDEAAFVVGGVKKLIAAGEDPSEIAVFYRVHAQSRVLEEVMRNENVPYQIIGGHKFFERAEVKDLIAYLRICANPSSDVDLLRIINTPPRKIGSKTVERLIATADEQRVCAFDAIVPLCGSDRVGTAAKRSLRAFDEMMTSFASAAATASPFELAEQILQESGYAVWLGRQDNAEADARLDNLHELLGSIREYEDERAAAAEAATLDDYLARVSLVSDVDQLEEVPRVPMMTVHAAKGLEFDTVLVTGLEERMFPLRGNEPGEEQELEEERRLAYVALTRARKRLFLSHTNTRMIYGKTRYNQPSRFLANLPGDTIQQLDTEALRDLRTGYSASWGSRSSASSSSPSGANGGAWRRPEPARPAGERYVEPEPHAGEPHAGGDDGWSEPVDDFGEGAQVRVGAKVRHSKFGVGAVHSVDSGVDPTVTVKFTGWGLKRIKLRFLTPP